jgi:spermidine synthase
MADSHFSNINSLISGAKGVAMHYTDGRNFLLTQSRRFDVISIEITSIWFAGAANLYNKDFYALAKTRLSEKGILQQWIQLHHISETDLIYAIGSVRSEFKYVWIYVRGGQGIIVASNNESALAYPGEALLYEANKNADRELQPAQLRSHLVLSPSGVDNLISHFDPTMRSLVSTDQNLFLEHSTPKGNALGNVVQKNIDMLSRFESGQHPADIR